MIVAAQVLGICTLGSIQEASCISSLYEQRAYVKTDPLVDFPTASIYTLEKHRRLNMASNNLFH